MARYLILVYLALFWLRRESVAVVRRALGLGSRYQENPPQAIRGSSTVVSKVRGRRPRVLIVHPYPIVPAYHGGGVRNLNLIRRLSAYCDLYVYVYSMVGDDPVQRQELAPFCRRVYVHRRAPVPPSSSWDLMPRGAQFLRFQKVREELGDIVLGEEIDIVQLEFAEMAQYVSDLHQTKVALTELDLSYVSSRRRRRKGFHLRFGTDRDLWSDRLSWLKLFRFEIQGLESVDRVHLMSDSDAATLAPYMKDGWKRLRVVPNGVDTSRFQPPSFPVREPRVLFLGSFGHTPNLDGVEYLLDEIWPLVRVRVPEAKLRLVGAHPPNWLRDRGGEAGVEVLGTVESTAGVYKDHRVMAAPIRVGSGTRLKILEAFASGLPVVSTRIGAEGIACKDKKEILLADGPGAFAEQLCRLLTDDALCDQLAADARALVKDRYEWGHTIDRVLASYRELLEDEECSESVDPPKEPDVDRRAEISVIIPTRDGGDGLIELLEAVRAQQIDRSVEVICIDSGSPARELSSMRRLGARVESIPSQTFNHGLTRDYAARIASGAVLVFVSQDAVPVDRLWLHRLTQPLFRPGCYGAIQGGIRERAEPAERFYWDSCGGRFYFTSESSRWISDHGGIGFSTVNAAIRRDLWQQYPFGWAPIMEDKKWQSRVGQAGHRIGSVEAAAVYHSHKYHLRSLFWRCQSEGWGWRMLGENYRFRDAIRDMRRRAVLIDFGRGLKQRRIRSVAEFVFPWIRPLALYWGNRWSRGVRLG